MSAVPTPSFEEALQRLAKAVEQLERGDLPLEKSIALFEDGMRLFHASRERLDQHEQRVTELLAEEAVPADLSAAPPTFEASIQRLALIVEQLERGDLPLNESIKLFEEGIGLSVASRDRLDKSEKRVEELLSVSESGDTHTRPLPTTA